MQLPQSDIPATSVMNRVSSDAKGQNAPVPVSLDFDLAKHLGHPDLLQVRYSPTLPIARKLQAMFANDYQYLLATREAAEHCKLIRLTEGNRDEIIFSGTTKARSQLSFPERIVREGEN